MQPGLPLQDMDTTYPGTRHTFEPVRQHYKLDDELMMADTDREVGRMPYMQTYDAAIRGLLGAGQPRPTSY